jgi:ParB-like chromosome segregation protein Spo0J
MRTDPIDNIKWVAAETLDPNNYNPNVVHTPELRLLEKSIVSNGWIQPILVNPDGIIIDGYHRWRLAQDSETLVRKYGKLVPVATLNVSRSEAMAITIRMNWAKGTHVAVRMSDMVDEMVNRHGMTKEEIATKIGATLDEVELLSKKDVFKVKDTANAPYSKAWVPEETRLRKKTGTSGKST